jgi:uncharacterized protein (DUF488 family)
MRQKTESRRRRRKIWVTATIAVTAGAWISGMAELVLTIGHSTHTLDEFFALLARHRIEGLVDIRRFPSSKKFPHFNQDNLAPELAEAGVGYFWLEGLGGRRHKKKGSPSPNPGLRNESFRNYADYMLTEEFQHGVKQLLAIAGRQRTALMCAEGLYWRCHRRLVSDVLTADGITVQHIMPSGELRPHVMIEGARIAGRSVTYPGSLSS